MLPAGAPQPIQPAIGLFLSETPPQHEPLTVKLESKTIDIPAGEADYAIEDSYVLPADVDVLERLSARALPREGDAGYGDAARRHDANAAVDPVVGFPLAGSVSLCRRRCSCRRARRSRCASPTTTRTATRGTRSARPDASSGGRSPPTRWARCGSRCCRGATPTCRRCSRDFAARSLRADIAGAEMQVTGQPRRSAGAQLPGHEVPAGRPCGRRRRAAERGAAPEAGRRRGAQQPRDRAAGAGSDRRGASARAGSRAAEAGRRPRALQPGEPDDRERSGETRPNANFGAPSRSIPRTATRSSTSACCWGRATSSTKRSRTCAAPSRSTRRTPTRTATSASGSGFRAAGRRDRGTADGAQNPARFRRGPAQSREPARSEGTASVAQVTPARRPKTGKRPRWAAPNNVGGPQWPA